MLSAWLTGIAGTILSYWLGTRFFGMSGQTMAWAVVASNITGYVSVLSTLALERRGKLPPVLFNGAITTWTVITALYVIPLMALVPDLRDVRTMFLMFFPLLLATGFMIPIFGFTQDRIIAWEQKRARERVAS
jgi:hypothetical protein